LNEEYKKIVKYLSSQDAYGRMARAWRAEVQEEYEYGLVKDPKVRIRRQKPTTVAEGADDESSDFERFKLELSFSFSSWPHSQPV
jgi:hypothetical protein